MSDYTPWCCTMCDYTLWCSPRGAVNPAPASPSPEGVCELCEGVIKSSFIVKMDICMVWSCSSPELCTVLGLWGCWAYDQPRLQPCSGTVRASVAVVVVRISCKVMPEISPGCWVGLVGLGGYLAHLLRPGPTTSCICRYITAAYVDTSQLHMSIHHSCICRYITAVYVDKSHIVESYTGIKSWLAEVMG